MQIQKTVPKKSYNEDILVVKTSILFPKGSFKGVKTDNLEFFIHCINTHKEFKSRDLMEEDPNYKQIIPYIVYYTDTKVFLMQRRAEASEQRLKNKLSVGIGGHIRSTDMSSDSVIDWAKREFEEEVEFKGESTSKILGLVNDDSNAVGQVHLGVIIGTYSTSEDIKVKSELKSGELVLMSEIDNYLEDMEEWSRYVIGHLKNLKR